DALADVDVLELETELELEVAAAANEVEAVTVIARAIRGVAHEQLEQSLGHAHVAQPEIDAVRDRLLAERRRRSVRCRGGRGRRARGIRVWLSSGLLVVVEGRTGPRV